MKDAEDYIEMVEEELEFEEDKRWWYYEVLVLYHEIWWTAPREVHEYVDEYFTKKYGEKVKDWPSLENK